MLNRMLEEYGQSDTGFAPRARYSRAMDAIDYLSEDCSYRTDRVDEWLTLFLHPQESRLVGLRVKGIKHIFLRASLIAAATADEKPEEKFSSLVKILELVVAAWGNTLVKNQLPRYREASEFARGVVLRPEDLREISQQVAA